MRGLLVFRSAGSNSSAGTNTGNCHRRQNGSGVVSSSLGAICSASAMAAEEIQKNAEELDSSLKEMAEKGGMDSRAKELTGGNANDPALKEYNRLKGLAQNNKINSGEFDRKTGRAMSSMESVQSAREGADATRAGLRNDVTKSAADNFSDPESKKAKEAAERLLEVVNGPINKAMETFDQGLKGLQQEFLDTDMSTDEFNRKLGGLKSALDEAAAAAKIAADAAQREAIIKGDFRGLDQGKAMEDRWFSFQMQRWNQWMDGMFQGQLAMAGFSQSTQNAQQHLDDFGEGMKNFGQGVSSWFEMSGGGGDISGGLAAMNSVNGQIASLTNTMASLNQILQLTNVTETRKQEVRNQMEALQGQINSLSQSPPPMFTGNSTDPFFNDPGLHVATRDANADNKSSTMQGAGGRNSGVSTTINFPNVNKFTSAEAASMFDAIEREAKRRGSRLYGVS